MAATRTTRATRALTSRERAFVRAVFKGITPGRAVLVAGYPAKGPDEGSTSSSVMAHHLLKRPKIAQALAALHAEAARPLVLTKRRVLREMMRIAFSDLRLAFNADGTLKRPADLDDESAAAISSIEVEELFEKDERGHKQWIGYTKKVKCWDKGAQLIKLAQIVKLIGEDNGGQRGGDTVTNTQVNFYLPHNNREPLPNGGPVTLAHAAADTPAGGTEHDPRSA